MDIEKENSIFNHPEYPQTKNNELLHLVPEFRNATERAAIAAAITAGTGRKKYSDGKAVEAMEEYLNTLNFSGKVVVGEGERDKAPMLKIGERFGTGRGPHVDIAVDPLENTNATADFLPGAISILAISEKGGLQASPDTYMDKLVVGPRAKGKVFLDAPPEVNLRAIAKAEGKSVSDLVVVVLLRDRNLELIDAILKTDARVMRILDGDLMPGIATCLDGLGIDAQMGIGAAPEGVITAAAVKSLGGEMQARFWSKDETEIKRLYEMGGEMNKIYTQDDLAKGNVLIISATGVTDGHVLNGVKFFGGGVRTHNLTIVREVNSNLLRVEKNERTHVFKSGTIVKFK